MRPDLKRTVVDILNSLEKKAPHHTAEHWDPVGLLFGNSHWKTKGAVISIDLTEEALKKAKKWGYHLVLTHHPALFPSKNGIDRIIASEQNSLSTLLLQAAQNQIAVASYHTNFDQCALEVISNVSKSLGINPMGRLLDASGGELLKLAVFVPATHLEKVRQALFDAGSGNIGNYNSCSFTTPGKGTFRGELSTHPFLGKAGALETVQEIKLETILPRSFQTQVLNALLKAHPYEEVAYDLYPIIQKPSQTGILKGFGYGFWGDLSKQKLFLELLQSVRRLFASKSFRVTVSDQRKIKRIAFVAGKGSAFIQGAQEIGCDLFITGETGYHNAMEAARQGMGVLEIGHRESEKFFLSVMQNWLAKEGIPSVKVNTLTQKVF